MGLRLFVTFLCLLVSICPSWILVGCFLPTGASAVSVTFPRGGSLVLQQTRKEHKSFLDNAYEVRGDSALSFRVRQVPGDGGCLFHAVTAWLSYLQTQTHMDFDWRMRNLSQKLRHLAVKSLQENVTMVLEHGEVIESSALLQMISDVYEMQPQEYCAQILDPRTWGGGPEIVALSNHFQCPIHVYQLCTERNLFSPFHKPTFKLEVCAKFGSPTFDSKAPICLLCADGRFPHVSPGDHKEVGDHFLALFPVTSMETASSAAPPAAVAEVESGLADRSGESKDEVLNPPRGRSSLRGGRNWLSRLLLYTTAAVSATTDSSVYSSALPAVATCQLSRCPEMARDGTFRAWMDAGSSVHSGRTASNRESEQRQGAVWGSVVACKDWLGKICQPRIAS